MACYHPLKGFKGKNGGWTSNRSAYTMAGDFRFPKMNVPCGQCIGCRLERARQWSLRITHEASLWEDNSFITLTYNDKYLPVSYDNITPTLKKADFQKFMKRLRKKNKSNKENPIRFFHCGEYGDSNGRPHYHAILFNKEFYDKKYFKKTKVGETIYVSEELQELWPFGHSSIGSVTTDSANYVARYCLKKVNGKDKYDHYATDLDKVSGEIQSWIEPEYATMSRRPGIGYDWINKYMNDVYPSDNIHVNGKAHKPPIYYDNVVKELYPQEMKEIKQARLDNFNYEDNTDERLAQKKACVVARYSTYKMRGKFK